VREWSEILHKDKWSKPSSNGIGTFIWKKYFQSYHVKKPQWSPFNICTQLFIIIGENFKIIIDWIANSAAHDQMTLMCQLILVCTGGLGRRSCRLSVKHLLIMNECDWGDTLINCKTLFDVYNLILNVNGPWSVTSY
jgi:hypothetical protein